MRILILYRELAAYLIPSIEDIIIKYKALVTIVVYSTNPEAPYEFNEYKNIQIFNKDNWLSDTSDTKYDIVFCSGWADSDYLKYLEKLDSNVRKVICFDSEFKFNLRKIFGIIFLRFFLRGKFDFAFVPGSKSFRFARFIGFSKQSILVGVYSADTNIFNKTGKDFVKPDSSSRPRRFLFVGRYVREKGLHDVCMAFNEFISKTEEEWELWCVGTGPELKNVIGNRKIIHLGFLQPHELVGILYEVDIFVMPSHSEPWGVVLHEMVLAGLPVLVSNKVNSRELFLDKGKNGFEFKYGNIDDLVLKMVDICKLYRENKEMMQIASIRQGNIVGNNNWSSKIERILS